MEENWLLNMLSEVFFHDEEVIVEEADEDSLERNEEKEIAGTKILWGCYYSYT